MAKQIVNFYLLSRHCIIKVFFLFVFSLFFSFNIVAQDSIRISGQLLNNTKFAKVIVKKFGVGIYDIAALRIDKESGKFSITAPINVEQGVYRFSYSQVENEFVDVIINGREKEIIFSLDVSSTIDKRLPKFTLSEENKALYLLKSELIYHNSLIEPQFQFLVNYPNIIDKVYQLVQKEYQIRIKEYQTKLDNFVKYTPYYWAKQMVKFENSFFSKPKDNFRLQMFYTHENFWNSKPTNDPLLINSPLYTQSILNYIQYYMNIDIGFSEEETTQGYLKCVDTIINKFESNEKTNDFALKYLQLGFKEIGNEIVLQYIDEKYAAKAQCKSGDEELSKRLKGYELIKAGNLAPSIEFYVPDGSVKNLFDYPQENLVLVFWASWCAHCMQEMPKLEEWAKNQQNTFVLAISLDENISSFNEAIKKFPSLLHYCDMLKWDSKIVKDYFIAATPSYIVLDKERKIKGKYNDLLSIINIK